MRMCSCMHVSVFGRGAPQSQWDLPDSPNRQNTQAPMFLVFIFDATLTIPMLPPYPILRQVCRRILPANPPRALVRGPSSLHSRVGERHRHPKPPAT